jgi:1,2-diacylglycerol 3-alpha-glucosyltransferase
MRILLVNALYPPFVGGSSIFASNLVEELKSKGHEVRVLTVQRDKVLSDDFSVKSISINLGRLSFGYSIPVVTRPGIRAKVNEILCEFVPDIVTIHGQQFDLSTWVIKVCEEKRIPWTVTVHSPITHPNFLFRLILRIGEILIFKRYVEKAKHIITVDKQTNDYVKKTYRNSRVSEIQFSLRWNEPNSDSLPLHEKFEIDANSWPIISSIGHVIPTRNRAALLDCLPNLLEDFPHLRLIIAGSIQDPAAEKKVKELELERNVIFLGQILPQEVDAILRISQIECHATQGIGIGLANLQAMQSEIPTIFFAPQDNWIGVKVSKYKLASLENGSPESIEVMIRRLLQDIKYREVVIVEQRRFIRENFEIEVISERYLRLFTQILQSTES